MAGTCAPRRGSPRARAAEAAQPSAHRAACCGWHARRYRRVCCRYRRTRQTRARRSSTVTHEGAIGSTPSAPGGPVGDTAAAGRASGRGRRGVARSVSRRSGCTTTTSASMTTTSLRSRTTTRSRQGLTRTTTTRRCLTSCAARHGCWVATGIGPPRRRGHDLAALAGCASAALPRHGPIFPTARLVMAAGLVSTTIVRGSYVATAVVHVRVGASNCKLVTRSWVALLSKRSWFLCFVHGALHHCAIHG